MGGHEGVVEALKLSGLSPALETQLAILVEDWDRAAAAFQAMALGIKDRNLLQLVRDVGGQLLDSHASHAVESKGERVCVRECAEVVGHQCALSLVCGNNGHSSCAMLAFAYRCRI